MMYFQEKYKQILPRSIEFYTSPLQWLLSANNYNLPPRNLVTLSSPAREGEKPKKGNLFNFVNTYFQ